MHMNVVKRQVRILFSENLPKNAHTLFWVIGGHVRGVWAHMTAMMGAVNLLVRCGISL